MRRTFPVISILVALFIALALSGHLAAQQHLRYRLIDLGTLGGPHSYGSVNGNGFALLNNSGQAASSADLTTPRSELVILPV